MSSLKDVTSSKIEGKNQIKPIPNWIKKNAGWWANGKIGDHAFVSGIQYLIKENILQIPNTQEGSKNVRNIPVWVKHIAGFWAEDEISDSEFLKSIPYLVETKLIADP